MLSLIGVSVQCKEYLQYSRLEDHCTNNTCQRRQQWVHKWGTKNQIRIFGFYPWFFLFSSYFSFFASGNSRWPYCLSMRQLMFEKNWKSSEDVIRDNIPVTMLPFPVLGLANISQQRPYFLLHVALEKTSSLRLKTDMLTVCTGQIILKIPAKTICPFPRTRLWKNKQFCSY